MQIESSEIFKMIEIVKNIPKERGYSSKTTETVNSVMFILKTMIRDYEDKELVEMADGKCWHEFDNYDRCMRCNFVKPGSEWAKQNSKDRGEQ